VRRAPPRNNNSRNGFWSNFGRGNSTAGQADPRYPAVRSNPHGNLLAPGRQPAVPRHVLFHHPARQTVAFAELRRPAPHRASARTPSLLRAGNGQALQYAVAVSRKAPPGQAQASFQQARMADLDSDAGNPAPPMNLPRFMEKRPAEPEGARALLSRRHPLSHPRHQRPFGEKRPQAIRMTNDDVIDLYNRTRMGATVIVQR
jgi:hypothetical protein